MQWPYALIVRYFVKRQALAKHLAEAQEEAMVLAVLLGEILSCCNEEFAELHSEMGGHVFGLLVGVEGIFHSGMGVWEQDSLNS